MFIARQSARVFAFTRLLFVPLTIFRQLSRTIAFDFAHLSLSITELPYTVEVGVAAAILHDKFECANLLSELVCQSGLETLV